jgi:hypothetical protein
VTATPRFKPLHPDFPVDLYLRNVAWRSYTESPNDAAAPFSFTSFRDLDPFYPALGWSTLRKIWTQPSTSVCDCCKRPLRAYGFAANARHGVIALVCLGCRLGYTEKTSRALLTVQVRVWGFEHFRVGIGAGFDGSTPVQGHGEAPTPEEARAQLFVAAFKPKEGA